MAFVRNDVADEMNGRAVEAGEGSWKPLRASFRGIAEAQEPGYDLKDLKNEGDTSQGTPAAPTVSRQGLASLPRKG